MKGLNASIRSRMISTAVGITVILLAIGLITNFFLKDAFEHYTVLNKVDRINNNELKLRKTEKNFLLKESINPSFYKTKQSPLNKDFKSYSNQIKNDISYLKNSEIIKDLKLSEEIKDIEHEFNAYQENFDQLNQVTLEKGFKDWGLVGEMRDQIHNVESIVEDHNRLLLTKYMLLLRRREKDYLLRKDLKYKQKFNHLITEFKNELNHGRASHFSKKDKLISALNEYQHLFMQVIDKDIEIGFTKDTEVLTKKGIKSSTSILDRIENNVEGIETQLSTIHKEVYSESRKEINQAVMTLFIILGVLSISILVILLRDTRYIVRSIKNLKSYVSRLGKGELPQEIEIAGSDEIANMKQSINVLTENLKNTRDFAIEVGNGNFEKEVNVFDNQGELGGSLIEMRKKLLQVAQEREQKRIEDERRIWINEGVSKFSEILRNNDKEINDLSFEILSNLVKYLGANQGGLFIKNDEDSEGVYYDLIAAYAYNRRKFLKNQIKLNEGLVGTCAMEKETIYMTDVPEDYVQITSGLGKATPRCLVIIPMKKEEEVLGVIEIATFEPLEQYQVEFIEKIAENVASNLYSIKINQRTSELLEKTQQQAEEMKAQEEEMRQNMEELTATQEQLSHREKELSEKLELKENEVRELSEKAGYQERELSENNAFLQSLLKGLNRTLVFAQFDTEGNLISSNKKYQDLFIKGREEEDHVFMDTIPQQERGHFKNKWKEVRRGEVYRGSVRNETSDGKFIFMKTALLPITDDQQQIQKIIYLSNVITKQEEADMNSKLFSQSRNLLDENSSSNINKEKDWEEKMKWLS
jgi:PAS domain-containing protein/HAMP domain-containing protein